MKRQLNEYRCTRNSPYIMHSCPGRNDPTARDGYYIVARSPEEAMEKMAEKFPLDRHGFTADFFKVWPFQGETSTTTALPRFLHRKVDAAKCEVDQRVTDRGMNAYCVIVADEHEPEVSSVFTSREMAIDDAYERAHNHVMSGKWDEEDVRKFLEFRDAEKALSFYNAVELMSEPGCTIYVEEHLLQRGAGGEESDKGKPKRDKAVEELKHAAISYGELTYTYNRGQYQGGDSAFLDELENATSDLQAAAIGYHEACINTGDDE